MVFRIYVEKKPGFDGEAQRLRRELVELLGIDRLKGLRLLNRYDVEGIDRELFDKAIPTVFSEPPVDVTYDELPAAPHVFAVEYLPGQFDQRADSASQCIQLLSQGERPDVRSAKVYLLEGDLTAGDLTAIKKYVINPVEAREASLETRDTLKMEFAIPTTVETLTGFIGLDEDALEAFRNEKGLAMDHADILFCQNYFKSEHRDPTITEIRLIDTYWSDHCRHTTFGTILDEVQIDDAVVQAAFDRYMALRAETGRDQKPRTLMDAGTIGAKALKQRGILKNLDESEEINACTVKIKCDVDGEQQDWLFLFKNETHNHPTEIEPFGGAATCIGGATGSSKAHKLSSLETCGAEVQKGNAPIERKLQRLFRREDACRMIKRCNDFGAGGVSVAIGELADGLNIDLNKVTRKYEGLDGTELAISESQERMAVAVAAEDADKFIALANEENLEATVVATVTEEKRMREVWNGVAIVDLSREFLNSNGAERHANVHILPGKVWQPQWAGATFEEKLENLVTDLNVCSQKGLGERFDSTIGAATVLMPYGGKYQLTPATAMVAKLPVDGETTTCSGMAWGFNPYLTEADPYRGAYMAVVESVTKLVCAGFRHEDMYLTFQEYFPHLNDVPERWGQPMAALLGALDAQMGLGIASIGGKDSMSGSFEGLDVPPTLVSFATAVGNTTDILSPEFKKANSAVVLLRPNYKDGLPEVGSLLSIYKVVEQMIAEGKVLAAATPGYGGIAEALFKMSLGNHVGLQLSNDIDPDSLFKPCYGAVILELLDASAGEFLGFTTVDYTLEVGRKAIDLARLQEKWEAKLEPVFPYRKAGDAVQALEYKQNAFKRIAPAVRLAKPRVVIPVFPGTNCEYDTARAFRRAGADPHVLVLKNLTPADVAESCEALVKELDAAQILMLPGGFSGGDEPDGSAKFITAFFRSPAVADAVNRLLQQRDGLALGICNGFQALIKLGLVPYGEIRSITANDPTLTFNTVGRHQSMLVRTRIASNKSPWLSECDVNDEHLIAISHGEGRFVCNDQLLQQLIENGQIATQYVDLNCVPTMDQRYNPNGSVLAIEGITSPDGRVLGKMGHTERSGIKLYKNVTGDKYQPLFEGGVNYFKL